MAPAHRARAPLPARGLVVLLTAFAVAGGAVVAFRLTGGRTSGAGPSPLPSSAAALSPSAPSPSPSPLASAPPPIPGYLLIADRANNRMLLVDGGGRILWRYPEPGTSPTFPFHFDDDAFFGPNHQVIISQQEDQQTIQLISFPGGHVVWHYGHADLRGSTAGYLSTPDDAYLLPDGTRTVADVRNCRVLFISPAGAVVRQIGTTGVCRHDPPSFLDSPNGDTPMPGGATLVTEINGSWVDAISATGALMWSVHAPVGYPSDAQWLGGGQIMLADYSFPGHVLIMDTSGKVLWKYGPASGKGELNHPSLALMLPNGLIAVNDDYRHRVVLISRSKDRIVWQYGHTDVPGRAPGYLDIPDGMDFLPFDVAISIPAIRALVLRG